MKWKRSIRRMSMLTLLSACSGGQQASSKPDHATPAIEAQKVADMLHAVMEADRTIYTRNVVNRLIKEQKVQIMDPAAEAPVPFGASEQWKTEHGKLPLPAQMFRMGAEQVTEKNVGFTYALLSPWPVNKQNAPRTDAEKQGLDFIEGGTGKNAGEREGREARQGRPASGEPEADDRCGRVRAEREQAAMGHVEDLHHAVDQGEAQGHDQQPRGVDHAVDEDRAQRRHGHAPAWGRGPGTDCPRAPIGRLSTRPPGSRPRSPPGSWRPRAD
jgi:hypothetical protein